MSGPGHVVIVGGGVMGSATATFLLADAGFDGRVTVVERDPTFRQASSALSAAGIRQQFSTPENIRLSRFSFEWMRGDLGIDIRESGYLYLAPPSGVAVLEANHAVQEAEGADVVLLTSTELEVRYPWMSTDGVALGSLGRSGEGWFDGYALLQGLRTRARGAGAELRIGEVVSMRLDAERITQVGLADGTTIDCDAVVDAAGPWAARVAAMAGVELPVEARRRSVFVFECSTRIEGCPLIIDTSGIWFRPEGPGFITGRAPEPEDDPADLPLEVDPREFEARMWPVLANRVPAFDAVKVTNAWAGYYEVDTFDHNAIIGRHPVIENLLFANGFSGHGIQQSPAVGRGVAELLVHGRYRTIDLSVFGFERLAAGRRVEERAVIG